MVTISDLAFPHLIDMIWAGMDTDTVLTCRNVSSRWRKRADKILQRHMLLHPADDEDGTSSHAILRPRNALHLPDLAQEVPARDVQKAFVSTTKLVFKAAFRHLQVLDVDFSGDLHGTHVMFAELLYEVCPDAVFRAAIPYWPRDTLIVGGGHTQVYFLDMKDPPFLDTPNANNVVLNFKCLRQSSCPFNMEAATDIWGVLCPQQLYKRQTVCHFHVAFRPMTLQYSHMYKLCCWLGCSTPSFYDYSLDTELTLVGLEAFFANAQDYSRLKYFLQSIFSQPQPYRSGFYPKHLWEEVRRRDCEDMSGPLVVEWSSETWERLVLRVLTRDEYEAEVGPETYKLQTVW